MNRVVLAVVLLSSAVSFAQKHSNEYSKCAEQATTQLQMNACAADELKRADAELNTAYQALLAKRKSDAVAVAKTRDAQRAWVKFRDAHMQEVFPAANPQVAYGSMFGMMYPLEQAAITTQRAHMLQQLLDARNPGE